MVVGEHQEEGSETEGGGGESPAVVALYLYGDVLESVVECLPAADLAATAVVSSEWLRAVRSVLRRRPRRLPWLVVHLVGRRRQTAAYDPHSGSWLSMHAPSLQGMPSTTLRHVISGRGDRLCALSLSGLDIAGGVLGTSSLCSRALKAPSVWRVDPVLAVVGELVVAVGGASEFAVAEGENGAGAVEVHEGGKWSACDPMPSELRESASSATWLSAAATDERLYVMDRTTGWASWLNPSKRCWGPTRRLRPEPDVSVSTWGIAPAAHGDAGAERLVLFGASKQRRQGLLQGVVVVVVVQAWEVDGDALDLSSPNNGKCDTMPSEMSGMLFPRNEEDDDDDDVETACWPSIRVCGNATGGGYVYNAAQPANGAVLYELLRQQAGQNGSLVGRWERVPCAPSSSVHAEPLGRVILACSPVGLDELPGGRRPLGLSQLASQHRLDQAQR